MQRRHRERQARHRLSKYRDRHPESVASPNAAVRVSGQGVVHLFADAGASAGVLEAVPEAVERAAWIGHTEAACVPAPPLREGRRVRAVAGRAKLREEADVAGVLLRLHELEESEAQN